MDLGLNTLTDDQLLDLLEQACGELANRDRLVREWAQGVISDEAEKLQARREAALEAREELREQYIQLARREAIEYVRELWKTGRLQLFDSPDQEAKVVAGGVMAARKVIVSEIEKELKDGKRSLAIAVQGPKTDGLVYVAITFGEKRVACKRALTDKEAQEIGLALRAALGIPF